MTRPEACAGRRHGRWSVAAAVCLAAASVVTRGGEEPGPVPLVRDAAPATSAPVGPAAAAPAGLGDWRLVAALGAVLAVLAGTRLIATRRALPLPPDVFEVLGAASLGGQLGVRIVRFGPKTLLVGISTAGATTLAEIGDPQATDRIAAACRGSQAPPRERVRPAPRPAATEAA